MPTVVRRTTPAGPRAVRLRSQTIALLTMIVLIDFHTGESANAIVPVDSLALISIRDGETARLQRGWKHALELAFADEISTGHSGAGFTATHADQVFDFCWRIGCSIDPIGLVIRCNHNRRSSAAIAKALGEWTGVWVADPGLRYSRHTYEVMRARIGSSNSPDVARLTGSVNEDSGAVGEEARTG